MDYEFVVELIREFLSANPSEVQLSSRLPAQDGGYFNAPDILILAVMRACFRDEDFVMGLYAG